MRSRLTHEIAYWDRRADEAAAKEQAGKSPGELNSTRWRQRANDLSERLDRRLAELELERRVTSLAPVVVGGALVIPAGLLVAAGVRQPPEHSADPAARTRVEQLAMEAVMAAERAMGHEPIDVSRDNVGYDILSRVTSLAPVVVGGALVIPAGLLVAAGVRQPPEHSADPAARSRVEQLAMDAVMAAERAMGHEPVDVSRDKVGYDILSRTSAGLRFVEVKGRAEGATTVTVTRGEIQTCLNEPEKYWLAVVEVRDDAPGSPSYLVSPFRDRVPFAATSVNFSTTRPVPHVGGPRRSQT